MELYFFVFVLLFQISFGALDPVFSNKLTFPYFYRTVPNENHFFAGMTELLRYFGWTWVVLAVSDDDSGEHALRELRKAVDQGGACVEMVHMMSVKINLSQLSELLSLSHATWQSKAQVFILYNSGSSIELNLMLAERFRASHKTWILSPGLHLQHADNAFNVLQGSLGFSLKIGKIEGLRDFLFGLTSSKIKDDPTLALQWQTYFCCQLNDTQYKEDAHTKLPLCSGNESIANLHMRQFALTNRRLSYSIYTAVYALAHALHDMMSRDGRKGSSGATWDTKQELEPWKLHRLLQRMHFKTPDGDEVAFDDSGDVTGAYEIINWHSYPANGTVVGSFNPSAPPGHQLVINRSSINWHSKRPMTDQIPRSACVPSCLPGQRKAPIEGKLSCCFACVTCAEGEFSNSTDMDNCMKCPDSHWPNERKDGCITRTIDFLPYDDYLGGTLASLAVVFFISTAGALGIFLRSRDTPIVRANNRNLSYMLLVSLMLSFLCSLLFIGRPGTVTCRIQQAAFGIIFTVAVSCVLAKTITVVIAFNATKPGSKLSRWLGSWASGSMVTLCTLGEVAICLSWQLTAPPHPDTDTVSETGKMILQCNQGSATAFYLVIGYMGGLAFASFIVAFLARNLPDRFNEAQLITFSMLVFCSVWVSFIPAYLSTKGRYMVAVEVFAILTSSAGLVGCIFIPKCYIILLRPDENIRHHVAVKINSTGNMM